MRKDMVYAINMMQKVWESKTQMLEEIEGIIQSFEDGTHDPDKCGLCAISEACCEYCPIVVFFGKMCNDFEVYKHSHAKSDGDLKIIINKLTELYKTVDKLEEW